MLTSRPKISALYLITLLILIIDKSLGQDSEEEGSSTTQEPKHSVEERGNSYGIFSAPGCPEPENGRIPWVKFPEDGKCYMAHTPGPCPPDTVVFINPKNLSEGYCDCWCFDYEQNPVNEGVCTDCLHLGIAKYPKTGGCYRLRYEQGTCEPGEWLVYHSTNSTVTCEPRVCPEGQALSADSPNDEASCFTVPKWCPSPAALGAIAPGIFNYKCQPHQFYSLRQARCVPRMLKFSRLKKVA